MSKICITCKSIKKLNNITYKKKKSKKTIWEKDLGFHSIFPNNKIPDLNTLKINSPLGANTKINISMGKSFKNRFVYYFGSDLKSTCGSIPSSEKSYKNTTNIGVTKTDKDGNTLLKLRCPNMYYENKNTYYPHVHFIIANKNNTQWINRLYAKIAICDINKKELKETLNGSCTMIINALSSKYFIQNRIPNSISLPVEVAEKSSPNVIKKYIKDNLNVYPKLEHLVKSKKLKLMDIPIIVYCYNSHCEADNKLSKLLLSIGFKNIKLFSKGIMGWLK